MSGNLTFLAVALTAFTLTTQEDPEAAPQVGKPAPAFRLNDHEGTLIEVGGESDEWTVLAFYPKAATPG